MEQARIFVQCNRFRVQLQPPVECRARRCILVQLGLADSEQVPQLRGALLANKGPEEDGSAGEIACLHFLSGERGGGLRRITGDAGCGENNYEYYAAHRMAGTEITSIGLATMACAQTRKGPASLSAGRPQVQYARSEVDAESELHILGVSTVPVTRPKFGSFGLLLPAEKMWRLNAFRTPPFNWNVTGSRTRKLRMRLKSSFL